MKILAFLWLFINPSMCLHLPSTYYFAITGCFHFYVNTERLQINQALRFLLVYHLSTRINKLLDNYCVYYLQICIFYLPIIIYFTSTWCLWYIYQFNRKNFFNSTDNAFTGPWSFWLTCYIMPFVIICIVKKKFPVVRC